MKNKIDNEKFNAKLIIDMCVEAEVQAREGIHVIATVLYHMFKYSNGTLEGKLEIVNSLCESLKTTLTESEENK